MAERLLPAPLPQNDPPLHLRLAGFRGVLGCQPEFVYFLYYLNLFPVATVTDTVADKPMEFSREGAQRVFETQGPTLVMDRFWTIRRPAQTYLYLPHAYLMGSPTHRPVMATGTGTWTSSTPVVNGNGAAWTLALLALLVALWNAGYGVLGAILVVLLGSNPFQASEVYARNNVFGWVITTGVLFVGPPRPDPPGLVIGVSVLLAYMTARALRPRTRAVLIGLLAVSVLGRPGSVDGILRREAPRSLR